MDIYRRKAESFWSESKNSQSKSEISLSEKDFKTIFKVEKRAINFKRIGLFILIFFIIWSGFLSASVPKAITGIAYAKQGAGLLQAGLSVILTNPNQARNLFISSSRSFQKASGQMRGMNIASKFLLVSPKLRSSIHLLHAGNDLAHTGAFLSKLLEKAPNQSTNISAENQSIEEILSSEILKTQNFLADRSDYIFSGFDNLNRATKELAKINPEHVPREQRQMVILWQRQLPELTKKFQSIVDLVKNKDLIFGTKDKPKKYLLIFQNDTELRPTGGFLGSYATLTMSGNDVDEWWVQKNIFKQDKAFVDQNNVEPPEQLKRIIPKWQLRDSNWDADFRDAAFDVARFYQDEGGTTTNGIIALDTTILEDLLKITGPIQVPGYDFTVDAENFVTRTGRQVELDYFQSQEGKDKNEPKTYIADLSEIIALAINNMTNKQKAKLPAIFLSGLERKSIMISFFDSILAAAVYDLDIDGHLKTENAADYLYLINANLGGKKSSRNVHQEATIKSKVLPSGQVEHKVSITRIHQGDGAWPDGDNHNLLQILVPKGSELLTYHWLNNDDEERTTTVDNKGKLTLFEIWFNTPVGQNKTLEFTYRTPAMVKGGRYAIVHQKQPGAQSCQIEQTIEFPSKIKSFEGSVNLEKTSANVLKVKFEQNQDQQFEVEF